MYLKTLEVHGFKSFANKIVFQFHDGITAIVGPNGSGKSNVADAVRWVLGEQSAKQLRGSNMQDIIFSGSEMRKAMAFAYVTMTFDNSDHKLPIAYEEVTVGRRVYRSGESEYLINGSPCRLREVQELFMDTGIGKEGYSIIGQGQIEQILSSKPEDRRELFDEAAGIVKFKKRKLLAEKNLEEERQNLSRVTDIINELEKQLEPLEKQAEVAKTYLKYKEELKILEVNQFIMDYRQNETAKEKLDENLSIVQGDLSKTQMEQSETKEEYERLEVELEEYNLEIENRRLLKSELQVTLEKTEGGIRVLKEQVAAILQNDSRLQERHNALQKECIEKREQQQQLILEKTIREEKQAIVLCAWQQSQDVLKAIKEKMLELQKEIDTYNTVIVTQVTEYGMIKSGLNRLELIREQNAVRRLELNRKLLNGKQETEEKISLLNSLKDDLERVNQEVAAALEIEETMESDLLTSRELDKNLTANYQKKQQMFLNQRSRLESVKNIAERYDGYGNSIRRVMERRKDTQGIVGVVADILKVDKEYETAIETALGGSIQNIVTDKEETAKAMIQYLKENRYGRATFLPLTSIGEGKRQTNDQVLMEIGVIEYASALVQTEPQFIGLIRYLLGRTLVVDDIDNAISLERKYGYSLRIVTLDGEQLNPGGSISGGAYKNSSNLLGRKRELEELEIQVEELAAAVAAAEICRKEEEEKRQELRTGLEIGKRRLQELYVGQNTAKLHWNQEQDKLIQLQEEFDKAKIELQEIELQEKKLTTELDQLELSLKDKENQKKKSEEQSAACALQLEEERAIEVIEAERAAALRIDAANLEQSTSFAKENFTRIENELAMCMKEDQESLVASDEFQKERKQREDEIELLKKKKETDATALGGQSVFLEELNRKKERLSNLHKEFMQRWEALSARKNDLDKELFRLQAQKEKLIEQINIQITYMWEEYGLTFSSARDYCEKEKQSLVQGKKEIADLKTKIKDLGDVNVNAIEDYRSIFERNEFLSTQRIDLQKAEETLVGIILELEEEMRRQFLEQFAEINFQFNEVFRDLFGGGRASLELVEDEDVLHAGIRIIAQPPGKKLQNMMQLSGGEKALTAISLLFAIQNRKPSPFCLLDEIEAALDDSNVKRFANYLKKLAKTAQFIVITHRRGTMTSADILYGITMQEKGISTLVSVNMIEGLG